MTPGSTLERLLGVTSKFNRERFGVDVEVPRFDADSTVCQDALIYGLDVDDYVARLEAEFGPVVLEIPWLRFTDQTASFRGYGCLVFPVWLVGRFLAWPFRGGHLIPVPDPRHFPHRLTLGHVAHVIDGGHWIEP